MTFLRRIIILAPIQRVRPRGYRTAPGVFVQEAAAVTSERVFAGAVGTLHYLVLQPVKRLSATADKVSLGEEEVEPYIIPGKDEISSLSVSFNRMRESLKHAMDMIK